MQKEMVEHQHIISSHHKEMQALREATKLAMERFENLSQKCDEDLKDFKAQATYHINFLKDRVLASEALIVDHRKTIEYLHAQLLVFHVVYVSKSDVEKLKKEAEGQMKESTNSHINSFQQFQSEFKALIRSMDQDFTKFKQDTEKKFCEVLDDNRKEILRGAG